LAVAATSSGTRRLPGLDDLSEVTAGRYRLGEPGEEREVDVGPVLVGRYPVTNAQLAAFVAATGAPVAPDAARRAEDPQLADHPATGLTFAEAQAFCAWAAAMLARPVRLPTGDEWEAAARGRDARPWPWGHTFDPERCACVESGAGRTVPVMSHPAGASPCGAEQLAGNVWEWVADPPSEGWRAVRGGSFLDHEWGVRASRSLAAEPARATATTGFRIAIDPDPRPLIRGGDAVPADAPLDEARIVEALGDVYDPCCAERGLSVVDMGLVEDVHIEGSHVRVDLVLTTGWCPFVASLSTTIPERLRRLDGVDDAEVNVVWDPVWTEERLSPKGRAELSMPLEQLIPYREARLARNAEGA
jgi:metal-sulfur cluster biosynthetic enzyme